MITAFNFFFAYLIVNTLCLVLTIIIASNVSRDSGSETQVRYFFLVLTAYLIFVVFDALWAFLAYSELVTPSEELLSLVNGINLAAIGFDAYFWMCFTLARFNSQVTNSRSMRLLLAIPALLIPVIHIVGYFTNQNVVTLPDGTWTYGVCHTIIACIQLSYIAASTVIAIRRFKKATTNSERHMSLVFVSFMTPFVVAGIVDMIIVNTPIVSACIIASLTFVMMSMQESRISSDALTGLNNRRRADEFLEQSIAHASPGQPLYFFIMDLNDFKDINDTYGHLEGDRALQLVADALRHACSQVNAFAARWGGDEFVIIWTDVDGDGPDRISSLIESALVGAVHDAGLEYSLTCSIGYARCESPDEKPNALISRADAMLYDYKRAHGGVR